MPNSLAASYPRTNECRSTHGLRMERGQSHSLDPRIRFSAGASSARVEWLIVQIVRSGFIATPGNQPGARSEVNSTTANRAPRSTGCVSQSERKCGLPHPTSARRADRSGESSQNSTVADLRPNRRKSAGVTIVEGGRRWLAGEPTDQQFCDMSSFLLHCRRVGQRKARLDRHAARAIRFDIEPACGV